jgi:suppressor of ftsI
MLDCDAPPPRGASCLVTCIRAAHLFTAVFVTSVLAAPLLAQPASCPDQPRPGEPDPDLYCIQLAPTARAGAASGTVHLERHPAPFGASVTASGVHRWDLAMAIQGLPDPSSLGPYTTYVAWATTPILRPVVKLGVVGDGEATLGPVAFNQFLILISAEASAEVETRVGPLVLRGGSASTRIQPHEIAAVLATAVGGAGIGDRPNTPPMERAGQETRDHAEHAPASTHGAGNWTPPPMHPEVPMPAALMRLRPDVAPYLPDALGGGIPLAHPARIIDLADGDSLDLAAGRVRRRIGGRDYVMYAFNEMYPGPLIRVDRGSTIVVRFENRTEWPTAVHWHGVRVENRFDGVPFVTQDPIPPGGRFIYQVRFPDAGIYWYHPHHREDVQQDLGLYGNLRVLEPGETPPVHREEILMLDDLLVGEEGLVPWGLEAATHALMGRFGNVTLVNGEPGWRLAVDRGEVVRFYFTNASNTRTWNISFDGAPMKLVATDLGPFEREQWVESIVLAPAERYVVDVLFEASNRHALVHRVQALDPIGARFFAEVDTLGVVEVGDTHASADHAAAFYQLHENAPMIAELDGLREAFDDPADRELLLTLEAGDLPFPVAPLLATEWNYVHPVEWSGTMPEMNWVATGRSLRWILRDPATGNENEQVEWRFRKGDLVRIRLISDRDALHPMHHPIHLHGQRFLVLEQGGTRNDNLAWKDTLLLPTGDVAELLVEMSNPGRWMLHCHISEHIEAGMKMVLTVE